MRRIFHRLEAVIAALQQLLSPSPPDLRVEAVQITPESVIVALVATAPAATCPECGQPSERVHSRYWRQLADLPIQRLPVKLRVRVRRSRLG